MGLLRLSYAEATFIPMKEDAMEVQTVTQCSLCGRRFEECLEDNNAHASQANAHSCDDDGNTWTPARSRVNRAWKRLTEAVATL